MPPTTQPKPDRLSGFVQRIPVDLTTSGRKGFFFIRTEDGRDWFSHYTELVDCEFGQIVEGTEVSFLPWQDAPKGPRAVEVQLTGSVYQQKPATARKK